jgi:hypothetical protein
VLIEKLKLGSYNHEIVITIRLFEYKNIYYIFGEFI